jgi:hypothetical protein
MSEPSVAQPARRTKASWAHRHPPEDPIERIEFRVRRAHLVLVFHVMRDLAALRTEMGGVPIRPARRRAVQRSCRALIRELAAARSLARARRIQLHRQGPSATAWLRRQLATLEGPR